MDSQDKQKAIKELIFFFWTSPAFQDILYVLFRKQVSKMKTHPQGED